MKLITKAIEKRFKELGRQDHADAVIVAKFFHPLSGWRWYATEMQIRTEEHDVQLCDWDQYQKDHPDAEQLDIIMFGMVKGFEAELGPWSMNEMSSVKVKGLGVERDMYWKEITVAELSKKLAVGQLV